MDALIDQALAPIRAGLEADGATLLPERVDDNGKRLTMRLVVSPDACADCFVGPEVMEQMILAALQEHGADFTAVTVINEQRTDRPPA